MENEAQSSPEQNQTTTPPENQNPPETTDKNRDPEYLQSLLRGIKDEAKGYRQSNAQLKAELEAIKRERAETSGDWKKIAADREAEISAEREKASRMQTAFGHRMIQDALEREAIKMGCIDTESVAALVDRRGIAFDEEFAVDAASVKGKLEDLRRRKPYLFQGKAPTVHSVTPRPPEAPGKVDLDKMSAKELDEYLRKNFR